MSIFKLKAEEARLKRLCAHFDLLEEQEKLIAETIRVEREETAAAIEACRKNISEILRVREILTTSKIFIEMENL